MEIMYKGYKRKRNHAKGWLEEKKRLQKENQELKKTINELSEELNDMKRLMEECEK